MAAAEINVLSGPDQGRVLAIEPLPCVIGRSPSSHVVLNGPGVWDQHAEVSLGQDGRLRIHMLGDATGARSEVRESAWALKTGESFSLGGVHLRFGLASGVQRSPKPMEFMAWAALLAVAIFQGWLLFRA
ncbi:MAG: FHA domain-containing protein [Verrucomicrobiota bacterium]|jgi:hypothetical protein